MRCLSTQVPRNEYPKLVATTHLIRLIKVVRGLKRCAWTSQITSRDNPRQRFSMVRSRCSPFLNRRHACPWRCNTIRSRNQHPCTLPFSASQTLNPINCALGFLHVMHGWKMYQGCLNENGNFERQNKLCMVTELHMGRSYENDKFKLWKLTIHGDKTIAWGDLTENENYKQR